MGRYYSGTFIAWSSNLTMIGGPEDNTFLFPAAQTASGDNLPALGSDTIIANPSAASNTLDFSDFGSDQPVTIDLGRTDEQAVSAGVLQLTLEQLVAQNKNGTSGATASGLTPAS